MCKIETPETGTIIGRRLQPDGDHKLAVAVTLTEFAWDALTDWINDLYQVGPVRPDLSLDFRIACFLDLTEQEWAATGRRTADFEGDLDDGVPF